jgi:glycosyltransferase involved in cell wall biosynthesis
MKVAIFEPHPSFGGGSERVVLDVSRFLAGGGHELFLLHDANGTMLPVYDGFLKERRQMPLQAFGWRTLRQSARRARRVARCWREWRVDAIFSSDIHFLRLLALAGSFARLPVVLHLGIPNPLRYWSQLLAFRLFAAGVAPSVHIADAWRRDGWPAARLHVVPNGVDTERFRPADNREAARKRLGLRTDRPIVVYAGRLVQEKGIVTLLRAIARLRAMERPVLLVLVGTNTHGTLDPWPNEALRYGVPSEAVHFAGRQTNPEDYLAAADLAVVPSQWDEPFGLAVIEAMASGTPPIVSDRGILRELVGTEGDALVFPAGNAEMLAERIAWWLEHSAQRMKTGNELAVSAATNHGLEHMGAAYEETFLRVARPV